MCAADPIRTEPVRGGIISQAICSTWQRAERGVIGYDEADVGPEYAAIAPGGGNAWHHGSHFAYMDIVAALVHRTVSGKGRISTPHIPRGLCNNDGGGDRPITSPRRGGGGVRLARHQTAVHAPQPSSALKDGDLVCAAGGGRPQPQIR